MEPGIPPPREDADRIDPARLRGRLQEIDPEAVAASTTGRDRIDVVRAPGRVNLIGEHTDYNEGFVLPAAIGLEIRLAFVATTDRRVTITLDETGETASFDLDVIGPPTRTWIDYVAGTARALQGGGFALRGLRGLLASTLPAGAGLSSSAALEMASGLAMLVEPSAIAPATLARAGQRAENEYVGVQIGIMDQVASAAGVADDAILLDCRSITWRAVPLPLDAVALVVCHSGSPHKLESSEYNQRRADCDRAVAACASIRPGVTSLRDVDEALLREAEPLMDEVAARRARHVVEENERVLATERALAARDLDAVGRLFAASHVSMRDLYEISSPELDLLVAIAGATPGVVGARLTGAGFGGSTINLVRHDAVAAFRTAVERDYPARTGLQPRVLVVDAVDGAGFVGG